MFDTLVNRKLHEMSEVLGYGKKYFDVSQCDVLRINNRESRSRPVLTYRAELYDYMKWRGCLGWTWEAFWTAMKGSIAHRRTTNAILNSLIWSLLFNEISHI